MNNSFTDPRLILIIIVAVFVILTTIGNHKGWFVPWYEKLKPGDKIQVHIYATETCDCWREAIYCRRDGRYIVAFLNIKQSTKCKECAILNNNSKDCWYHVQYFTRHDIRKIK